MNEVKKDYLKPLMILLQGSLFKGTEEEKRKKKLEAQLRVGQHITAISNHSNLISYSKDESIPAEEKAKVYELLAAAIASGHYGKLKGEIASGQADAPDVNPDDVEDPETQVTEIEPEKQEEPAVEEDEEDEDGDLAEVSKVLKKVLARKKAAEFDEERVMALIQKEVAAAAMANKDATKDYVDLVLSKWGDSINDYVTKAIAAIPPRDTVEIRKWDGSTKEIKGMVHKQFPMVLKTITSRKANGFPINAYLFGAPAGGKTHLCGQLAEALSIPYYPLACARDTTSAKIIGFLNMATGAFVEGAAYRCYKEGGLLLVDEIDNADSSVLTGINSLVENSSFRFPNGELVQRHHNFYVVASGNTIGTGSQNGFERTRLDAATRTRFSFIRVNYDVDLERRLAGHDKWVDYVLKVREFVDKNCQGAVYVTPRASLQGAALLTNGVPVIDVVDMTILNMMGSQVSASIINSIGYPNI